ncbi:mediator complex subunit [Arachnomyces sp. PD_36]|nr:mediator complex subunit [Arachnomyces sp. PD_36]
MDDNIDVDDLFGDPGSLELGLHAPSPAKGLAQRLDELHLLGCCRKIAWSKLGCIAYISQDNLAVYIRHLRCRPDDGKWVLSDDTLLNQVADTHGGCPLLHLSWNEAGSELAVADSAGRISVFPVSMAMNSFGCSRNAMMDPDDDGNQVVGMLWLNVNRPAHGFQQALKSNGRWGYPPFRRQPVGPFHPANRSALLCVTRTGQIRLLYQNPDNRWAEVSAELKTSGHSDSLLTHAGLVAVQEDSETGNGIMVATYSESWKISLYRVHIKWDPAQWDPSQMKHPNSGHSFPTPSFHLVHSKVETPSSILPTQSDPMGDMNHLGGSNDSLFRLTHLEVIACPTEKHGDSSVVPFVVGVFSVPVHALDHSQHDGSSSVIVRWQLETAAQNLHSSFDDVVSKKPKVQIKNKTELRRLEDFYSDRFVVSIDQIDAGNVLAVTYDDSSIAFLNPMTMKNVDPNSDESTISGMAAVGFNYPIDISGLHISFSPSGCLAVALNGEWDFHLRYMEHPFGAEDGQNDDDKSSAVVASLVLAFARACGSDNNTDDILTVALRQLTPDAQRLFIHDVYRALPMHVDFTFETDKLMSNPYIVRCLSVQAAVGFKSNFMRRDLISVVPWIVLNLRHISVMVTYFLQYTKSAKESGSHDTEVLRIMHANVRWALDFSKFLVDDLFATIDTLGDSATDSNSWPQIVSNMESPSLIILLSSMSRSFLRYICRGFRGLINGFRGSTNLSGESLHLYSNIYTMIEESPLKADVYEKLLAQTENSVKHIYQGVGLDDAGRSASEKELLVTCKVPSILTPAVAAIFTKFVPSMRTEVDRMELYLFDYSWLGVCDDKRSELYRRTYDVDVLKKKPLLREAPENKTQTGRRCVRCCGVAEDTVPTRALLIFRMGMYKCAVCGGLWTIENRR